MIISRFENNISNSNPKIPKELFDETGYCLRVQLVQSWHIFRGEILLQLLYFFVKPCRISIETNSVEETMLQSDYTANNLSRNFWLTIRTEVGQSWTLSWIVSLRSKNHRNTREWSILTTILVQVQFAIF